VAAGAAVAGRLQIALELPYSQPNGGREMLDQMLEWYDLTDDERKIRDLARQVAREEIAPRADAHDRDGTYVRDSMRALGEAGLMGVYIPKEYGGLGGSPLAAAMTVEILSAACGSTGMSFMFHNNLIHVVNGAGPEALKQKYFPQLAKGKIGAFAINERRRLFRERFDTEFVDHGDHYVITGEKPFVTTAGEADVYIVQAQASDSPPSPFPVAGQRYILVEGASPGVSAWVYEPIGLRGASNGGVKFESVEVPKENAVGEEPGAMIRSVTAKGNSVLGPHLIAQGCAGAALEAAVRYVRKRGRSEWMVHALTPMSDRLNALRAYVYYTARMKQKGFSPALNHAHNEIQRLGGEVGPEVCDRVMEIMGGRSLMSDSPIQRYYRDARTSCFPAFTMEDRRANSGDGLFGRDLDLERNQPETIAWDPYASYGFWLLWARGAGLLSEEAQAHLSRPAFEEHARSKGSDEVTFQLYIEYLAQGAALGRPGDDGAAAELAETGSQPA
jgi:alkylation response protein AidB-like acyl-CoA dehydrogenase